jgi:hypothetical protein
MSEQLHKLGLVAARLQLVEDLSKPLVTHIGQGFGRQLGIRCRAASSGKAEREIRSIWERPSSTWA